MTVRVIALVEIREDNPAALAEYMSMVGPWLNRAGARITRRFVFCDMMRRFALCDLVAESRPTQTMVISEYPNLAAVDMFLNSREYLGAGALRARAFKSYSISVVVGDDRPVTEVELQG